MDLCWVKIFLLWDQKCEKLRAQFTTDAEYLVLIVADTDK